MKSTLSFLRLIAVVIFCSANVSVSWGDVFGTSENAFEIEFVTINDPGNAADTHGTPDPAGAVPYSYGIGKFEISEQMVDKANVLGGLGVTKDTRGPDKPATSISWFEAAKFVNWLNASTGHASAYKFNNQGVHELWHLEDAGYDPDNLFRNQLAKYVLPSADEWYKAAYFDPVTESYFEYPTGSDNQPIAVVSGIEAGTAVIGQSLSTGPADITAAGGLSPFGTMGQAGNAREWQETELGILIGGINDEPFARRLYRGGSWPSFPSGSSTTSIGTAPPNISNFTRGFRVVSVPEPHPLLAIAFVAILLGIRRASPA